MTVTTTPSDVAQIAIADRSGTKNVHFHKHLSGYGPRFTIRSLYTPKGSNSHDVSFEVPVDDLIALRDALSLMLRGYE